jgi:AraC-like DNA-binding protein
MIILSKQKEIQGQVMENNDFLFFTSSLLDKLHITSHIFGNNTKEIPKSVDGGLRSMLYEEENYTQIISNFPIKVKDNIIYRFFDEYQCHYVFFKIPNKDQNFTAGPYLRKLPKREFIEKKLQQIISHENNDINEDINKKISQLEKYYRNVPIIEDENVLLAIINTLGTFVFNGANNFSIEYIDYEIPDTRPPISKSRVFNDDESKPSSILSLELIEENYRNENNLMDAVSKGKLNQIDMIVSSVLNHGTENRISDSIRNRKNYMIILNTILRKAAEYGQVHPYHINKLSSKFAKKIEMLNSVEASLTLQAEMIRKYCLLVKDYSLKNYSHLIGRVITLISYDLKADLSLNSIADQLNVNASYLSARFKKECNMSLTNYVNQKRMELAANLLSHSDKQIQEIADACGILDTNYFIKLFKKQYGITPSQYRDQLH